MTYNVLSGTLSLYTTTATQAGRVVFIGLSVCRITKEILDEFSGNYSKH